MRRSVCLAACKVIRTGIDLAPGTLRSFAWCYDGKIARKVVIVAARSVSASMWRSAWAEENEATGRRHPTSRDWPPSIQIGVPVM
ncbi:MAG: hypothetical protein WDN30_05220 [Pararobbsia sp.]